MAGPLVWSLLGNVPVTALGLLLVLQVEERTGSFASAGLAAAGYALGLGVSAPIVGRLVDARGQVVVIAPLCGMAVAALIGIALLSADAPPAATVALATAVGVGMPPGGSVVRAMWVTDITDPDARHALFAVHSAGTELTYILGPVALAGAVASVSIQAAVLVTTALVAASTTLYLSRPAVRRWRSDATRTTGFAGPLESAAVRVVLLGELAVGIGFGAIEVGAAATADAHGGGARAGLLLGAWGLGSMLGALVVARRPAPDRSAASLARRFALLTVGNAPLLLATDPWVLGPLLVVAGLTLTPALIGVIAMLGDVAPSGTLTEAYSWSTCCIAGGMAVGSSASGVLADASAHLPYALAVGGPLVVVVLLTGRASVLDQAIDRSTLVSS